MKSYAVACIAAIAVLLSGCAYLQSPAAQPFDQIAVAVAVDAVVGVNPVTQASRAHAVKDIAEKVLAADTGVVTTVAELQAVALAKVQALGLPPGDAAAALILLTVLNSAADHYVASVASGASLGNAQVAVAAVCKWVIDESTRLGG